MISRELFETWTEEAAEFEGVNVTSEMVEKLWDTYSSAKQGGYAAIYNAIEDKSLIQTAVRGLAGSLSGSDPLGRSVNEIYRDFAGTLSDVQHLDYYDKFLEQGESTRIANALRRKGIPLDVLRNVKKGLPMNGEPTQIVGADGDVHTVQVYQSIEKGDDGSPNIDGFRIDVDGETVHLTIF